MKNSRINLTTRTLPAAIKNAGATSAHRTVGNRFNLGFTLVGTDFDQPGNGAAVLAAASARYPQATVTWAGTQADPVHINFDAA